MDVKWLPVGTSRQTYCPAKPCLHRLLNHLGIANGPAWLFAKEIASGAVRRLFPEYERRKSIFALRAGGRRLAAKTTVFIDFLVEIFAKHPQFIP
jgi:LysR family transcriptional regulator for bpeEF and oprC